MRKRWKVFAATLVCMTLMICISAYAEGFGVYCEYDDGSRIEIENGCTIKSDGELMIALEGLDASKIYRMQLKGVTIDGTPFVDHRGTGTENTDVYYFTLTHEAGVYGPFELVIRSSEESKTLVFSVDVQPDKDKDWLEYGILNDILYTEMPQFVPVEKGELTAEMQAEDFAILEPTHGAVLSGDENCELGLLIDLKVPDKEIDWKVYKLATNEKIAGFSEKLPFVSTLYMPLEASDLEYGCEYVFEVIAGNQRVHSMFSIVEEKMDITGDAAQTAAARRESVENKIDEDLAHEMSGMNTSADGTSDTILQNRGLYKFRQIQKNEEAIIQAALYDKLVDEFNNVYATYSDGFMGESSLFAYNKEKDEGVILQSFAKSMSRGYVPNMKTDLQSAETHLKNDLQEGIAITDMYSALGIRSILLPIHSERMEEVSRNGNGSVVFGPAAYMQILTENNECIADVTVCAEWVNDQICGPNRYVFVRFMDPLGDGSQVYEWCVADQSLVKELIILLEESGLEWLTEAKGVQTEEVAAEAVVKKQSKVKVREGGNVNVRQKSSADSARVGSAKGGAEYLCLSVAENGWFQIQLENGEVGFISGKMATLIE